MNVCINDERRDVPEGLSVAGLLEMLNLHPKRVAVERNRRIVRRMHFAETTLASDDRLEIVTLVGGG